MRPLFTTLVLSLAVLSAPFAAQAAWKVTQDGAALVENGGDSSLSLRCDNNANTGNRPNWRLEITSTALTGLGPRAELEFRFPGQRPFKLQADNRLGHVFIDGLNLPNQSDMNALISKIKAASRVSVILSDASSGVQHGDPLSFNLTGSSRAVRNITNACH